MSRGAWSRLPREFWILWAGTIVNKSGAFVVPLLTFYLTGARGMTLRDAGAIVALHGVGTIIASLVGGSLADRIGRRTTMVASLFGGAAILVALGMARGTGVIAALTLALGAVGEMYRPAVQALVADITPPSERQIAYGLLYWAVNIGVAIAPVLGGALAGVSYAVLFIVDGVTMAAFGIVVLVKLPRSVAPSSATPTAKRATLGSIVADHVFLAFVGVTFLQAFVLYQHTTTLSGWMAAQGFGPTTYGIVIATNGAMIVLLQPLATKWFRPFGTVHVLAASAVLSGFGVALHGIASSAPLHAFAVAIWTLGEIMVAPAGSAFVANYAPIDARGRYQGMYAVAWGMAASAAPFLGSRLLAGGGGALWVGCLAVGLAAAAGYVALTRPIRRATA